MNLIGRIKLINFKSQDEFIDAYQLSRELAYIEIKNRKKRFDYFANLFGVDIDSFLFDALTNKQEEQISLLWKLVDLEWGSHEV